MSNRARQRKVRFRSEDLRDDQPRAPQRRSQQGASSKSSWSDSVSTKPLLILLVLLAGTLFTLYSDPRVKKWLYGSRAASNRLKWWQSSIIYQVYPRSFQDSDGDGVGDIRGECALWAIIRDCR